MSYRRILQQADAHFRDVAAKMPEQLQCGRGCSFCCYGLFEIGLGDVATIGEAVRALAPAARKQLIARAERVMQEVEHPNIREIDSDEKEEFFERTSAIACPALNKNGECVIYENRPIVCRTFGLPIRDADEYIGDICELNFTESTPEQQFEAAWDLQLEDPVSPEDQFTIPEAIVLASRKR